MYVAGALELLRSRRSTVNALIFHKTKDKTQKCGGVRTKFKATRDFAKSSSFSWNLFNFQKCKQEMWWVVLKQQFLATGYDVTSTFCWIFSRFFIFQFSKVQARSELSGVRTTVLAMWDYDLTILLSS